MECVLGGFDGYQVDTHIVLSHEDLFAANTVDNQDNVVPHTVETSKIENDVLKAVLEPYSWNVIRMKSK